MLIGKNANLTNINYPTNRLGIIVVSSARIILG